MSRAAAMALRALLALLALLAACGTEVDNDSLGAHSDAVLGGRYDGHPNTVMLTFLCGAAEIADGPTSASGDEAKVQDEHQWSPCERIPPRAGVVLGRDSPYVVTYHDPRDTGGLDDVLHADAQRGDLTRAGAIELRFAWTGGRAPPVARVLGQDVQVHMQVDARPDASSTQTTTGPWLAVFQFDQPVSQLPLRQGDARPTFTRVHWGRVPADEIAPDARTTSRLSALVLGHRAETSRLRADGIVVMQHLSFAEERGLGAIQAQVAFEPLSSRQPGSDPDRLRAFYEVDERSLRCSGPVRGHGVLEPGDVGGPVYERDAASGDMTLYAITSRAELVYGRALSAEASAYEPEAITRHRALYERIRQQWPEFHAFLAQAARTEGHRVKLYGGFEAIRVDAQAPAAPWLHSLSATGATWSRLP